MTTHRERLETALAFREPDRVPVEMHLSKEVAAHPKAQRLVELQRRYASNFIGINDWADSPRGNQLFMGLPADYTKELIEDKPGELKRWRHTYTTDAGAFTAITYHPEGVPDYHWEKRYFSTADDLRRLIEAPRPRLTWNKAQWEDRVRDLGDQGLPMSCLWHPLGNLARNSDMQEMYGWFIEERGLMHKFLEATNTQIADHLDRMLADGVGAIFAVYAHEMFIPPWMGHENFDEFVFPYDKRVYDVIHRHGRKVRIHCHGNAMDFLDKFVAMGVDSIEPLEQAPMGDVNLAEAKRIVGDRLFLSGNIQAKDFYTMTPDDVRRQARDAMRAAAPGGGFSLCTDCQAYVDISRCTPENLDRFLQNWEAYILAGVEYGQYPIKV